MDEGTLDVMIRESLKRTGLEGLDRMTIWEIAREYPQQYGSAERILRYDYDNENRTDFEELGEC